ncbi:MAG: anti-sigma factor [Actinomycetes bacterium]
MSIPELHTLTGAYAVDALEGSERDRFEEHLRDCGACRDEVAELTATASRLAAAVAAPAPGSLRAAVLAEVAHTRQLAPLPSTGRHDELAARRWYRQPVAAAAAVLLVVSVALGTYAVTESRRADRAEQRAEQIVAIVTHPERIERPVRVSTGGTGTVIAADGEAVFRASDVRTLPDDRVYQLWLIRGDRPQSAGVLGRGGVLEAVVTDMAPTDALGLTVEPAGGSTSPTGELLLRVTMA